MGEHERLLPNGLLPNEAASVIRVLDSDRWLKAEERTAELISCIQPNEPSEERRNAVADYVQRLISKCFPCEVFTFGSVPLKTYLPDGDIDVTAFSKNQTIKESWAHQVRDILEVEEKNENAEFHVKEVQYIQAEVKIIKCLVENIVVDISFNQLGGLCTLCFLEEVDHLINQDHLFKKSIILIKAWCYYESRILGAHHGLISTYALETLVLYIFHVFNNSFAGPLEVLYRFLEFFSKFDWDNFCVSLWGPVPISSLPDVSAEPPRKDSGELLLSKPFLEACSAVYAVGPGVQETNGQHFVSKFFNVIDPLRVSNNLGRSVSKGNFFRIRSAFAFGAKRLARLLDCPKEDIYFEVNQFFMNTWDRHGSGQRPDAPRNELWRGRLSPPELSLKLDILRNNSNSKISGYEALVDMPQGSYPLESSVGNSEVAVVSRTQSQKTSVNLNNTRTNDQSRMENSVHTEKNQRISKPDNLVAGEHQGRYLFARTRSSPELTETYGEVSFQGRRNRAQETGKGQTSSSRLDNSRRINPESEVLGSHSLKSSTDDPSSVRHTSSRQNLEATVELSSVSSSYQDDSGMGVSGEEFASALGAQGMHQEEQDFVNIMASSGGLGFNGQVHFPLNLGSNQMPYPISPSVLASMGYAPQRNLGAMLPSNIPLIENLWGTNMQFPQGLVSSPLTHYFPGMGMTGNTAESVEPGNENFGSLEMNTREADHEFWHEVERGSTSGFDLENGGFEMHQVDEKHQSSNFVSSSRISGRVPQKFNKDHGEVHLDDRSSGLRPSSSLRSRTSSESSWEGSSVKTSKSSREKRNRKTASSAVPSTIYGKGKNSSECSSNQIDDEIKDWNSLPSMGPEMLERSLRPLSASATQHVPAGFETSQTSGSESLIPLGAPMLLGPNSRQRTPDDSGVLPFTFYPAGPPVPFVMLPMYNLPTETGNSDASTSHFSVEEVVDTSDSGQNFESTESLDQSEVLSTSSSMLRAASGEPLEQKPDILHSDFASHWQNLQYGRFCQSPRYSSPLVYGPSLMVPPTYLQGRFPWDGPGRPLSTNMNIFTQLMGYGPRIVPAAPLQSVSTRPSGVYQPYVDELPRYRSGTGTYLPNPAKVPVRDRHSTNSRKGNYSYDRNDQHHDREGNWNTNSKPRASGRSHNRNNQAEKSSSRLDRIAANETRTDRTWANSHRHDTFSSYQSQNGPVRPNSSQSNSSNVAYGMYPLPSMNHGGGVSSNGPAFPPVVMLYPYDRRAGFGGPTEQLEFGTLGPVGGFPEVSHLNEGSRSSVGFEDQRFHGSSTHQSSPDQPSSPLLQR
ncbi:PAP/OAS1 substrate-binding domain superfamily [Euphorbia peplus]|nr:PAP/OAS1 substrate-binding domain superfamily [Euphorbia peplus]